MDMALAASAISLPDLEALARGLDTLKHNLPVSGTGTQGSIDLIGHISKTLSGFRHSLLNNAGSILVQKTYSTSGKDYFSACCSPISTSQTIFLLLFLRPVQILLLL